MATYFEIVARADELKPNTYTLLQKYSWLNKLDRQIKSKIIDTHEDPPVINEEVLISPIEDTSDLGNAPLLVPEDYDILYVHYLFSQIDYYNREFESFNNSNAMYQAAYREYANWYNRTHRPLSASNIYF